MIMYYSRELQRNSGKNNIARMRCAIIIANLILPETMRMYTLVKVPFRWWNKICNIQKNYNQSFIINANWSWSLLKKVITDEPLLFKVPHHRAKLEHTLPYMASNFHFNHHTLKNRIWNIFNITYFVMLAVPGTWALGVIHKPAKLKCLLGSNIWPQKYS